MGTKFSAPGRGGGKNTFLCVALVCVVPLAGCGVDPAGKNPSSAGTSAAGVMPSRTSSHPSSSSSSPSSFSPSSATERPTYCEAVTDAVNMKGELYASPENGVPPLAKKASEADRQASEKLSAAGYDAAGNAYSQSARLLSNVADGTLTIDTANMGIAQAFSEEQAVKELSQVNFSCGF